MRGRTSHSQRRHQASVLAVLLGLTLTACGLSEDEQDAAESLSTAMVIPADDDGVKDAAPCIAEKWVGELGTDRLRKAGLLDGEGKAQTQAVRRTVTGARPVPRPIATSYGSAWYACADFDALSLDLGTRITDASTEELDEYADCLKQIDDDAWRRSRTQLLLGRGNGNPQGVRACRSELNRAVRG